MAVCEPQLEITGLLTPVRNDWFVEPSVKWLICWSPFEMTRLLITLWNDWFVGQLQCEMTGKSLLITHLQCEMIGFLIRSASSGSREREEQMVEILTEENRKLHAELAHCYKKVSKLQKVGTYCARQWTHTWTGLLSHSQLYSAQNLSHFSSPAPIPPTLLSDNTKRNVWHWLVCASW